ncbi:MAG: universal stress protein, partial [Verrucomicrobia bacterium]|nr:universal stress protein [Verrucomicrobiota bacterium]
EITQAAESLAISVIVMSTHGYSGFKRFCLGSTAEDVVRGAPCPVLTIRCAEADDDNAASREEDEAKPWGNRSTESREVAIGTQGVEACSPIYF